jgi:hypothetical protein
MLAAGGIVAAPAASAEAIPPPCHEEWTLHAYAESARATGYLYCAGQEPLPCR